MTQFTLVEAEGNRQERPTEISFQATHALFDVDRTRRGGPGVAIVDGDLHDDL